MKKFYNLLLSARKYSVLLTELCDLILRNLPYVPVDEKFEAATEIKINENETIIVNE